MDSLVPGADSTLVIVVPGRRVVLITVCGGPAGIVVVEYMVTPTVDVL